MTFKRSTFVPCLLMAIWACASSVVNAQASGEPKTATENAGLIDLGALPAGPAGVTTTTPAAAPTPTPGPVAPVPRSAAKGGAEVARSAPAQRPAGSSQRTRPGAAAAAGLASPATESGTERAQFNRLPVKVELRTGQERLVSFPNPVAVHVPSEVASLLRVEAIDQTVYIRALAPLEDVRILAEDLVTHTFVPMDLRALDGASPVSKVLEVLYARPAPTADEAAAKHSDEELDYVDLTRYAAQAVYAPRRLMPARPGVRQVPVRQEPVPGLIRGNRIAAQPIGQWRSGSLYVTAVKVVNLESKAIEIDLEQLRGDWHAATAQQRRLLPKGSDWDTTTLYLICDRPFEACR